MFRNVFVFIDHMLLLGLKLLKNIIGDQSRVDQLHPPTYIFKKIIPGNSSSYKIDEWKIT